MTAAAAQDQPAFSPRLILALIAVGLLCFAAFAVFSANAPDSRSASTGATGPSSKTAVGFAALTTLLKARDVRVLTGRVPAGGYPEGTLVVLTPGLGELPDPTVYGENVRVLVVAPKWRVFERGGKAYRAGLAPPEAVAGVLNGLGAPVTIHRVEEVSARQAASDAGDQFPTDVEHMQTLTGDRWEKLMVEQDGTATLAAAPLGVFVLTEPDLFNNHGLSSLNNARVAIYMVNQLRGEGAAVAFPSGSPSGLGPLPMLFRPPLLGATLCAVAALLLVGGQALVRFGATAAEDRAYALGARGLIDNSAALVRMAGKEHLLAPDYANLMEATAAKAAGIERGAEAPRLARLEERRSVTDSIETLALEAAKARNRFDLLAIARRLHAWKQEMTREGR